MHVDIFPSNEEESGRTFLKKLLPQSYRSESQFVSDIPLISERGAKVAQEPYKVINLFDWTGGVRDRRRNPLAFPANAVTAGENVDLTDGGLKTRPGMSVTHPDTSAPNSEFRVLKQIRFPTTETTYLIAQASERHPTFWEQKAAGPERESHSAVWDAENGRMLVFGGRSSVQEFCGDLLAYYPDEDTWTTVVASGSPPSGRYGHSAVLDSAGGFMYVFGGRGAAGALNDCYKLDISTDTWSEISAVGAIPSARYNHAAVLIPGSSARMLVNGGRPISSYVLSVHIYYVLDLSTCVWTEVESTVGGGLYMHSRCGHSLVYDGTGAIYLFGGDYLEAYWQNCWKLNLIAGTWHVLADLPATLTSGLAYHSATYCSGHILCLGGRGVMISDWNTAYQVYDCAKNTWLTAIPKGDPGIRCRHVAVATDDSRIIIHGGVGQLDPEVVIRSDTWYAKKLCSDAAATGFWGGSGLYASSDYLPTTNMAFEGIYKLSENAGVVSIETLGDRAIITEGVEEVPLVFVPGALSSDPVSSWASPLRVLLTYDGVNFHEVSDKVLDNDIDSIADIGGVTTRGWIAICCDVPTVKSFYFEFQTPSSIGGATTEFSDSIRLNEASKIDREDIKGRITRWIQDSGGLTGHFEADPKGLVGAAADLGGDPNLVKIPCEGHGFVQGDSVEIRNSANYDGTHNLPAQTGGDQHHFIIQSDYYAETFSGDDRASLRLTLGAGRNCPLVETGVLVAFGGTEVSIKEIAGNGDGNNEVTLSSSHAGDSVNAIYGITVNESDVITLGVTADAPDTLFDKDLTETFAVGIRSSIRLVVPSSDLATDASYIKLTIAASEKLVRWYPTDFTDRNKGLFISHCSIVERYGLGVNGTDDGVRTPTQVTFGNGQPGARVAKGVTITSDLIPFTIDRTKDYLVTIDCSEYSHFLSLPGNQNDPHIAYIYSGEKWNLQDPGTARYELHYDVALTKLVGVNAAHSPTRLHVVSTNDTSRESLLGVDSIKNVSAVTTTPGNSAVYFAVSLDIRQSWSIYAGTAWRYIAEMKAGTWWYNNGASGVNNWVNTGKTDAWEALRSAFSITQNQMTHAQLAAVSEAAWRNAIGYSSLDFCMGLKADGDNLPTVTSITMSVYDSGGSECAGWVKGDWDQGSGWSDGTSVGGVPFVRNGTISYNGGVFTADYGTIAGIPGFWYRVLMRGTSKGTALSKVRYQAPVQPLQNIGDGQADTALGFVFYDTSAGKVLDYTVEMSDSTFTAAASAPFPTEVGDFIYVGYLTEFNEIEIIPYSDNNQNISSLTVKYWNGISWSSLSIVDGTSDTGRTFRKRGKIKWTLPSDWKQNIPLEGLTLGYWLQLSVSANLSGNTMLSECRVYPVPDKLVKHKGAAVFQNRLALFDRPDAPGQVDISREALECCFTGEDSYSYNLGNQITCGTSAWNTLLLGGVDSWNQLESLSSSGIEFQSVESARHVPVNSRVIVKAPLRISEDGDRYGLFFINQYGAFCQSGLATDSTYGTSRSVTISDTVNWWNSGSTPRLDKNYLHVACGEYWPVRNWVIWAVPMILSGDASQAKNNRLIVFDLSLRAWLPLFDMSLAALTTAYHYNDSAPGKIGAVGLYAGDYQGRVLRIFGPEDETDAGVPINAWLETGWLHLGSPEYRKILRLLSIYGKSSSGPISVSVYCDGEQNPRLTLNFDDLADLGGRPFALEQESNNIQGRFYKFRISFAGPTDIYGLQLGFALVREWGA